MSFDRSIWYPVASSMDLPKRHVYQAQLLGREFAIWRADDGHVNVWENRCLHRGVRLSIGINNGSELKCQYHGWRYANRTAGCTYIPAHPADAPAQTICNNTYKSVEKYDMIWTCEEPQNDVPNLNGFENYTLLRPITINSSHTHIEKFLKKSGLQAHYLRPQKKSDYLSFKTKKGHFLNLFIQPQDSNVSILRGVINIKEPGEKRIALLKKYNWLMIEAREKIELESNLMLRQPDIKPKISKVSEKLSKIPKERKPDGKTRLRVRVAMKTRITPNIIRLRFESVKEQLPTFHPGAHIDLQLQNGLIRQYSLTNGPGETDHYSIAVKVNTNSKGGSKNIDENVSHGDILAISAPHNNFPLLRNSPHTIFIAGGIGITPLLAMAKALQSMYLNFEFHYFIRSEDQLAFKDDIKNLGQNINIYKNLSQTETLNSIKSILNTPKINTNIYVCGPGKMISETIKIGINAGWNETNIRYEYFKNNNKIEDSSSFQIDLARSAMTLTVPSGKTILEILTENGIKLESSCEQGACGTCKVRVIKGEISHQDVYLNTQEKLRGDTILTCVSRAKSDRLILDI